MTWAHPTFSVLNFIIPVHVSNESIKLETPGHSFSATQIFPPLSLFPFAEGDFPSALQVKLLHTLSSNSSVTYCESFSDLSHSQGEMVVFLNFEVDYLRPFLILSDYFYIPPLLIAL